MAFLNKALTNFRDAVNKAYPNRDKGSDGWIGDAAHQATNSDHNPDPDGSVDAWDMDVELNGAGKPYEADVQKVINAALKHESIQYVIYNRRITSRTWGLGIWRAYDGPSPHQEHVHFNTRSSYESSSKPWIIEGEEDDMTYTDSQMKAFPWQYNGNGMPGVPEGKSTLWVLGTLYQTVSDLKAQVEKLSATPPGTVAISDDQLERVLRKVVGSVDNA